MASSELLSQDEINALLRGVENNELDVRPSPAGEGLVHLYDFSQREHPEPDALSMLDVFNERFARQFKRSLSDLLRCKVDISVTGVQSVKFSEYLYSQPVPVSINLVGIKPMYGNVLCVLDPELVFHAVEAFFGGAARYTGFEGRDFSPTEHRLVRMLLELALSDLGWAWKPLLALQFSVRGMQDDPYFAHFTWPEERALVCGFRIEMADAAGNFSIVLPPNLLKQIPRNTDKPGDFLERDAQWSQALSEELKTAQVTLNCSISQADMRLSDLLRLKVGDVLPIESADSITVFAEDVPVCRGAYGIHKGRLAVKIRERIGTAGNGLTGTPEKKHA